MKQRDLVLSIIDLCCDRPEFGRTSLQKVAYFVSQGLHQQLGHKAHFYGPFSEDVEDDVEGLLLAGLIDEKATSLGFQSYGGDAAKKYECSMTDAGNERVEALRGAYPKSFKVSRLSSSVWNRPQADSIKVCCHPPQRRTSSRLREHRPVKTSEIRTFGARWMEPSKEASSSSCCGSKDVGIGETVGSAGTS